MVSRLIVAALLALIGAVLPQQARALDYPNRPVHVIIPFTAGGAPDVLLRLVAQKLSEKWGQGVVVDNRAGGNTLVGTLRKIYGQTFAAGHPATAKLSEVLLKLNETSLSQLRRDHETGHLDKKISKTSP